MTNGSTKFKFLLISSKESLEFQQKNALRKTFLRALLCSNDNSISGCNRKMLNRKISSIPNKGCFNYEQLFHPVQCTAFIICQCSSKDKLVLPRVTGILSTLKLPCLWTLIISVTVHDKIEVLYQS